MKYPFPYITHIDQVRNAVAWHADQNDGKTEFIEADRGDFIVFNYLVSLPTTFPNVSCENAAILRELRGLIFDAETERVISRPFHKFFNLGEKIETEARKIDVNKPHIVLDKVDGSFIRPFRASDGKLRWGTKMGETDVAENARQFVEKNPKYIEFGTWLCDNELTGIFEWTSRKNRIVVDYAEDNLTLLAIRHNVTGEYIKY